MAVQSTPPATQTNHDQASVMCRESADDSGLPTQPAPGAETAKNARAVAFGGTPYHVLVSSRVIIRGGCLSRRVGLLGPAG